MISIQVVWNYNVIIGTSHVQIIILEYVQGEFISDMNTLKESNFYINKTPDCIRHQFTDIWNGSEDVNF